MTVHFKVFDRFLQKAWISHTDLLKTPGEHGWGI